MSAGIFNMNLEQYATFNLPMVWKDSNGNPIDLTTYTALMDVKDNTGSIITSLSTTNGAITLGGVLGTITLSLSATATSALPPGIYNYDLLMTSGSTVTRLIEGSCRVMAGVTP